VLTPTATLHTETGRRLLDDLSDVDTADRRENVVQLAKATGTAVPQASVAFLVFGGGVTPSQIQQSSMHIPLGVRVIAIAARPGASMSLRQLGDITLLTVGELTDLPRALRRASS
jgi:hypothetical protein